MISWIRYFACTDDSRTGKAALQYLAGLVRVAPVRLIPTSEAPSMAWRPYYERLLVTPMAGAFVNVVCTQPERWAWTTRIQTPARNASTGSDAAKVEPGEVVLGELELYTAGVRNVLLPQRYPSTPNEFETASKYDAVVTQDEFVAAEWRHNGIATTVIPFDNIDHARFRALVLGEGVT